jgi:hypothetical protein
MQPTLARFAAGLRGGRGHGPPARASIAGPIAGAVVPGGLDQQPAGRTAAGLGIGLSAPLLPEECSAGVSPTKEPMLALVNRVRSPISTARANPSGCRSRAGSRAGARVGLNRLGQCFGVTNSG